MVFSKTDSHGQRLLQISETVENRILDFVCESYDMSVFKFVFSVVTRPKNPLQSCLSLTQNLNYGSEILKFIMSNYPITDVMKEMNDSSFPLEATGNPDVMKILLSTLDNEDEELRLVLNKEYDINDMKWSVFLSAIWSLNNNEEVVKLLLQTLNHKDPQCRIQLNARNGQNNTALHLACKRKNNEKVALLLNTLLNKDPSHRIDLNAKNSWHETALHIACQQGLIDSVSLLLETLKHPDANLRIQLHARNSMHKTAFDLVVEKRNQEIINLFLPYYLHQ